MTESDDPPSRFNLAGRVAAARRRFAGMERTLGEHTSCLGRQAGRLQQLEESTRLLRQDFARIEHQLGALEAKVETLRRDVHPARVTGDPEAVGQAVDVLQAVRREHEQVRTRFQVITRYEERLSRLEGLVEQAAERVGEGPRAP